MPDRSELAEALERTQAVLEELTGKVEIHQTTLRRNKIALRLAVFGLVLDMTLTVLVGWGLFGVGGNQAKINQIQATQQTETDRTQSAECAFVTLFLQFEPKTINNPAYTADQHAIQAQAYSTLRQIGADLQCPK